MYHGFNRIKSHHLHVNGFTTLYQLYTLLVPVNFSYVKSVGVSEFLKIT